MLAQWLGALPEVSVADDGSFTVVHDSDAAPDCDFEDGGHDGLLTFLEVAAAREKRPVRVKVQVTGPLTLGMALHAAGVPAPRAFRRAAEVTRTWSVAVEELVGAQLPDAGLVLFFDEPTLVSWHRGNEPLDRESAIDVLSGALASVDCVTGVHVCSDGDARARARGRARGARRRGERRSRPAHRLAGTVPRRRRLDCLGRGADRPTGG